MTMLTYRPDYPIKVRFFSTTTCILGDNYAANFKSPTPLHRSFDKLIQGRATLASTTRYSQSHSHMPYKLHPTKGFLASKLGIGTYRPNEVLEHCIRSGANVIDTSAHFQRGEAERSIRRQLSPMFNSGEVTREELVLVSKAGYAFEPVRGGHEMPSGNGWHCITPEFLDREMRCSMTRLGMQFLDIFLIQSPERCLGNINKVDEDEMVHI